MLQFAVNGIASLSYVPLRLSLYLGLIVSLLGFIYGLYGVMISLMGHAVPGWTSLLIVTLTLGGFQLTMLGLVGIYIGRIYNEVKNRPLYIVREVLGLEER